MSWPSFHNFWFFWTIACSSHLFCKILNFHSYSQNMFNFQPSRFLVLCILFSYKSSQIYQHAFQRLFIECITCDHFAFCKAIGILHKFQMYHGLQQGEINFPFNFITFLISSSSFFFFFNQDSNLLIPHPLDCEPLRTILFVNQELKWCLVREQPFIYSEIFIEPCTHWQFLHLISSHYFNFFHSCERRK